MAAIAFGRQSIARVRRASLASAHAGAQADITITTRQAQQKPYLFLPAISAARFTPVPALRNLVSHPVTGAPEYFYMFRHQADFFVQLAVHRLFRGFAWLDAALRELPRMLPLPLAPEYLILVVRDNDADIRTVAVSVYHWSLYSVNFNGRILSHFHPNEKWIRATCRNVDARCETAFGHGFYQPLHLSCQAG